ncbi:interleukin 17a/f2 [Channa argus]|uniref:interleukin 17a/f2 n=1 Tax=Channa argus TaxID=215402 RepID=UPI0029465CC8|nr:hypothetical protein Q8A73_002677 [Channa argus]
MKLRIDVFALLLCCGVLWPAVASSYMVTTPPPPVCDSTMTFSTDVSSSSDGNGNIHSRSLSPWTWRSTTVKNRIPSTLWEAECSGSFCSNPNPGHRDRHNLNSVPVYQNILVLNRQEAGDCYIASYKSVAVGCTCVWAKISQN